MPYTNKTVYAQCTCAVVCVDVIGFVGFPFDFRCVLLCLCAVDDVWFINGFLVCGCCFRDVFCEDSCGVQLVSSTLFGRNFS